MLCARADNWTAAHLTPAALTASLSVETWTDLSDDNASLTAFSAANHRAVLTQPGRFRAVRDAAYTGACPPVPSRHPGTDTALADLADELRRRCRTFRIDPAQTNSTPAAAFEQPYPSSLALKPSNPPPRHAIALVGIKNRPIASADGDR